MADLATSRQVTVNRGDDRENTLLVKAKVKVLHSEGGAVSVFLLSVARIQRGYQSIPDMVQEAPRVTGKKFFVHVAGRTNEAYQDYVAKLKGIGQIQVSSPEECDYIVVFCPIVSRAGTDIGEALQNLPGEQPTILVVMHHTFNPNYVVAGSRRQVDNPNVRFTVDCLFYEGKLLKCNRNDIAWYEIQKALGVPAFQVSLNSFIKYIKDHPLAVFSVLLLAAVGSVTILKRRLWAYFGL
ncbi:uncharacterized protein AB9X84_002516 [Acanthopagrus schlegelii]